MRGLSCKLSASTISSPFFTVPHEQTTGLAGGLRVRCLCERDGRFGMAIQNRV